MKDQETYLDEIKQDRQIIIALIISLVVAITLMIIPFFWGFY